MITVRLRWSRGIEYYKQSKWRGTWKLDGGVVANQSAHFIDLLQWLFGMPKKVFSKIRQLQKIRKKKLKILLWQYLNIMRKINLDY